MVQGKMEVYWEKEFIRERRGRGTLGKRKHGEECNP